MNKGLFVFVIILMGISLAGIILLQLFWINNAISIREDHFDKTVNIALRETAEKLESHENILFLSDKINKFNSHDKIKLISDSLHNTIVICTDTSENTSYSYNMVSDQNIEYTVSVLHEDKDESKILEYKHEVKIDSLKRNIAKVKARLDLDSLSQFITHDIALVEGDAILEEAENAYVIIQKAKNLNEAFIKMAYEIESSPVSIRERVDVEVLQNVLNAALANKGIHADHDFAVMTLDSSKYFPIASQGFEKEKIDKKYVVSLFPDELSDESHFLVIQFPGRNVHILKSMAWTLAGSFLLTLIILSTFGITISMILRQKKLSDIKSDFINNMTHEFKTPIATISLAIDAINNPRVLGKDDEVKYYTGIIREENQRMNNQVEHVLRMSLLDRHDMEFNMAETNIHEIISIAISKVSLLLKEREGNISLKLESRDPILKLDASHFTNAVLNLLDNAIKYSEGPPEIEISTHDMPSNISLKVQDRGMGMSKDTMHKIFDKFYRKSSGNIHNVKGFGLGLSYVKAIITAFGGKISASSEQGKGSTFEIILPKPSKG
ncbi:MAG: HAMP domain-containing sensor histidine kinase [Bacteroidota bacterium]